MVRTVHVITERHVNGKNLFVSVHYNICHLMFFLFFCFFFFCHLMFFFFFLWTVSSKGDPKTAPETHFVSTVYYN